MLVHFKLDKYSSLSELDLLLSRLSQTLVELLTVLKEQDTYSFEYSFDEEEKPSKYSSEVYDLVFSLRSSFLTGKLEDASLYYHSVSDALVTSVSLYPTESFRADALLESVTGLDKISALLEAVKLQEVETDMTRKIPGTRKMEKISIEGALQEIRDRLSSFGL